MRFFETRAKKCNVIVVSIKVMNSRDYFGAVSLTSETVSIPVIVSYDSKRDLLLRPVGVKWWIDVNEIH
jgi:hypothetical protein